MVYCVSTRIQTSFTLLVRVEHWLGIWLRDALARGRSESVELWAARRTIRSLLSDVVESREKSRGERHNQKSDAY